MVKLVVMASNIVKKNKVKLNFCICNDIWRTGNTLGSYAFQKFMVCCWICNRIWTDLQHTDKQKVPVCLFWAQLSNIKISKWPLGLVTSAPLAAETSIRASCSFSSLLQAKLLSSISAGLRSPIHPFHHLAIHATVHHHPSVHQSIIHPSISCPVCLRKQWLPWWCLMSPAASRTQTSAGSIDVFTSLPATVVHLGSLCLGGGFSW